MQQSLPTSAKVIRSPAADPAKRQTPAHRVTLTRAVRTGAVAGRRFGDTDPEGTGGSGPPGDMARRIAHRQRPPAKIRVDAGREVAAHVAQTGGGARGLRSGQPWLSLPQATKAVTISSAVFLQTLDAAPPGAIPVFRSDRASRIREGGTTSVVGITPGMRP